MAKANFKRIEDSSLIDQYPIEDGNFWITGDGKTFVDYGDERIPIAGTPDTEMSDISRNTVENNVIKEYVDTNFGKKGKILWRNQNPSTISSPLNITLSSDDYDFIIWVIRVSLANQQTATQTSLKGYGVRIYLGANYRIITRNNDTSYTIGTYTEPGGEQNCIPIYAIGYNTGLFS